MARKPQLDLVSTNVMHAARWDILLVTNYVQLGVKRVLSAVIRAQPLVQQPVTEPATLPVPEPVKVLPQEAVTKSLLEPSPQPVAARVPERSSEPRRSTRQRNEPKWLKDYVT